jgi:hypothetical protein
VDWSPEIFTINGISETRARKHFQHSSPRSGPKKGNVSTVAENRKRTAEAYQKGKAKKAV